MQTHALTTMTARSRTQNQVVRNGSGGGTINQPAPHVHVVNLHTSPRTGPDQPLNTVLQFTARQASKTRATTC